MKEKQYPPQTGAYIVKVKSEQSTDSWRDFDAARLQISVGKDYHEGDKLAALADWCAARFTRTQVCVNDTLQRFNLMFERTLDEVAAERITLEQGREWIARNARHFARVPGLMITHWDEWKARAEYERAALKIEWLYASNPEFRDAIDRNVEMIWSRRREAKPDLYKDEAFDRFAELSTRYLLEETAVFAVMFEAERAIDIYPGTTLFSVTVFRGREAEGAPPGLGKGHFCRIDFSKNRKFAPGDSEPGGDAPEV